jgi:hypothetical protein
MLQLLKWMKVKIHVQQMIQGRLLTWNGRRLLTATLTLNVRDEISDGTCLV